MRTPALLILAACSPKASTPPVDACALDPSWAELATHDGVPARTIHDIAYQLDGYSGSWNTVEEQQWEAARLTLDTPTTVHALTVRWWPDQLKHPDKLTVGLYPDFGHNGFDFDSDHPLWEGTPCHLTADGTATYVLDPPVTLQDPGLAFVAHLKKKAGSAVWWLDDSVRGEGNCAAFDDCHAAWAFPELDSDALYRGWSLSVPWDYLVTAHVETEPPPTSTRFRALPDLALPNRSSWGDVDGDGDDDLLTAGVRLYANDGGSFTDVTEAWGLDGIGGGGGVWGDLDNDGDLDLFVFHEGATGLDRLLRNDGDTFTDLTESSGITDLQTDVDCDPATEGPEHANTSAAAWVDLDADGLLDLYLANMLCWGNEQTYADRVWHARSDGTFEDWSDTRGFAPDALASRGVSPADHDGDGDVDLLVHSYRLQRNVLYDNQGDGTVVERAAEAGVQGEAAPRSGATYFGHSIGSAWGDLDGDGLLDLVTANLAHPRFYDFSDRTQVLLNNGDATFADVSETAGLRYQETHSVPALGDLDLDGHLDLIVTAIYDGRPTDVYRGHGDGSFTLDVLTAGITTTNGWGIALADVDLDGDLDVATDQIFVNEGPAEGSWLQVGVVGNVAANRAGLGANVYLTTGDRTLVRHVQGGTGQGGQDSRILHFGLGEADRVDRLRVVFPGGTEVVFDDGWEVGQRLWLFEDGSTAAGWTP